MQKQPELDWIGYVLRDLVTFLADNEMMQSAQMLAVAAAHIEHDMKGRKLPQAQAVWVNDPKIVEFPIEKRRMN